MQFVQKELEAVFQPLGWLWIFLWALVLWNVRRKSYREAWIGFAAQAVLYVACNTPLVFYLLGSLEKPYDRRGLPDPPTVDAVVMLGGTHSRSLRSLHGFDLRETGDRVLTAVGLIRRGVSTNLVLGGAGYQSDEGIRPDSEMLIDWIRDWRLVDARVYGLGACRDTHDEAVRTANLARKNGWRRIVLVSSANHLRRGEAIFRKAGLDLIPVGCDYWGLDGLDATFAIGLVPRAEMLRLWSAYIHEQLGWYGYQWRGWI